MKAYTIDGREYQMADSYNEITLRQLIELSQIEEMSDEFEFEKTMRTIAILSGVKEEELDDMVLPLYGELASCLTFLLTPPDLPEDEIFIKGKEYSIRENKDRTMGEMAYINRMERELGKIAAIPYVLACLIRPCETVLNEETHTKSKVQKKFSIEEVESRAELFMDCIKYPHIIRALNFFMPGVTL